MATIDQLWEVQAIQQIELGLDPKHQDMLGKIRLSSDLAQHIVEEGVALSRAFGSYKRHLLRQPQVQKGNVAEKCADVVKLAFALAQLHGVSAREFVDAFNTKTRVVSSMASQEREVLSHDTPLAVFDLDDVICDLSPWVARLNELQGSAPPNPKTLAMMEQYKDECYASGRFGTEFAPVRGAPEGVRAVKAMGYKIVILTARPQWQYKRLYGDTISWLERHGIPADFVLFNKDKVEALHAHLSPAWPTIFVDDMPRNVSALAAAGVNVLMFDARHNQDYTPPPGVRRVSEWPEVVSAFHLAAVEKASR